MIRNGWTTLYFVEPSATHDGVVTRGRWTNLVGPTPARSIEAERDPRTSLVAAIAQDLLKVYGGRLTEYWFEAKRLLERAFDAVEQSN